MKQKIKKAWDYRINLEIEQTRLLLSEIKNLLSIPVGPLDQNVFDRITEKASAEKVNGICHVYLITASLFRADHKLEQSSRLIQIVEEYLLKNEIPLFFQVHFQKGLNFFYNSDYSNALELFLSSKLLTQDNSERIFSLCNALFCLDNLGLAYEATFEELKTLIKKNKVKSKALDSALSQVKWFEHRFSFRNGELKQIFDHKIQKVNQAYYMKIWTSELPYHKFSGEITAIEKEKFYLASPEFYLKSYRLRTLQGILHPDDLVDQNIKEFVDRLYLWTWQWLCHPESFPVQKILSLFDQIDFDKITTRLSSEDFQMMRNALLWLSLFDVGSGASVQRLIRSLKPSVSVDFELFRFEHQLILYLTALRDKKEIESQDYLKELKQLKFWDSKELFLRELVDFTSSIRENDLLSGLKSHLDNLINTQIEIRNDQTVIDFSENKVSLGSQFVVSEPICMAFDLFRKSKVVDCSDFASVCFGLKKYDSFVHQSKIFNLLARMRKLSPSGIDFSVKTEKIYFNGSLSKFQFINESLAVRSLKDQLKWKNLLGYKIESEQTTSGEDRWLKPSVALKKALNKKDLTRKDLEELTGKSRSTANRLIERWLKQGIIQKTGKAKNTRYVFCKSLPLN